MFRQGLDGHCQGPESIGRVVVDVVGSDILDVPVALDSVGALGQDGGLGTLGQQSDGAMGVPV